MNWKTVVAKFVTHASAYSTYLVNGFIEYFRDFLRFAFHVHTETYLESPDSSFPVCDTESNPCWLARQMKNLVWGQD